MPYEDTFSDIARFYDRIMEHVNYDRWYVIATELATLLPHSFRHLDAACGTGTLAQRLCQAGWDTTGCDLSLAMLRRARKGTSPFPAFNADLRALPVEDGFDYITCLFDSINFLLDLGEVREAIRQFAGALRDGGILYFDVITERMVLQYFAGQEWVEDNGAFKTTWNSRYDSDAGIVTTEVRVHNHGVCTVRERVYRDKEILEALEAAGLQVLGAVDAEHWGRITRRTVRMDFVAVKGDVEPYQRAFRRIREDVKVLMGR